MTTTYDLEPLVNSPIDCKFMSNGRWFIDTLIGIEDGQYLTAAPDADEIADPDVWDRCEVRTGHPFSVLLWESEGAMLEFAEQLEEAGFTVSLDAADSLYDTDTHVILSLTIEANPERAYPSKPTQAVYDLEPLVNSPIDCKFMRDGRWTSTDTLIGIEDGQYLTNSSTTFGVDEIADRCMVRTGYPFSVLLWESEDDMLEFAQQLEEAGFNIFLDVADVLCDEDSHISLTIEANPERVYPWEC